MITSDSPFDRLMFDHQHHDDYHMQHSSHDQQEMGPWNNHLNLKPIYHSIQISTASNKKQLRNHQKSYGHSRYKSKQILQKKIFQQIDQKYLNQQNQSTEAVIFQKQNGSPQLKRLTHLPVISAREEYGDIFKYMRPMQQNDHQSSTRSLPKANRIYRLQEQLTVLHNKKNRRKLSEKVSSQKDRINVVSPVAECKEIVVNLARNPEYLPSIDKFLNRNGCYDIYERCVVRKQKNMKEREKSVQYRLL